MLELLPAHSADVRLRLILSDRCVLVQRFGPGYIVPRFGVEAPAGEGDMEMSIDGRIHRWRVRIAEETVPWDDAIYLSEPSLSTSDARDSDG